MRSEADAEEFEKERKSIMDLNEIKIFKNGFAAVNENLTDIAKSLQKLTKKNVDMIVANNLKVAGAGFGTDTNVVTLITKEKEVQLEIMPKEEVAVHLLDAIFFGQ